MTWSEAALLATAVLALLLWATWSRAHRLDRLHRKVAASRAALDVQLVRRGSVAAELAASGLLDPASAMIVGDAAWAALSLGRRPDAAPDLEAIGLEGRVERPGGAPPGDPEREQVESELSRALRAVLDDDEAVAVVEDDPTGAELVEALAATWYRVHLARRFHNDAVRQAQRIRRKALVRWLHLAGHAPMPRTVEFDDAWPGSFDHRSGGER